MIVKPFLIPIWLLIVEIQNHNPYRDPESLALSLLYIVDINPEQSFQVLK